MTISPLTLIEQWRDRAERDFTPFADSGTPVVISADRRNISVSWIFRTEPREAVLTVADTTVSVLYDGVRSSYESFFAGPAMADLRSLAKMILQVRKDGRYVSTIARRPGEPPVEAPATQLIRASLADGATEDVSVVLVVTGDAGAGKTSVLQELVREQADSYLRGQTATLYLYVNAQGRALARFHEALATELQDLRATLLTYHGVAALVRLGLIVPIIDGFDELLGVGGYDDAFSSLSLFIEELDGRGQLVASARSTYYEQEFMSRAGRVSSSGAISWKQIPIEVLAWSDREVRAYVELEGKAKDLDPSTIDAMATKTDRVFRGINAHLRSKPLFVARTVALIQDGTELSEDGELLDQLVGQYVARERDEKLIGRTGGSLLTTSQTHSLLEELAEEMWNQETRELDKASVQELAEYKLLEFGLAPEIAAMARKVVPERMPSMAFVRKGETRGSIAFEHETFFSYFLGTRLASRMEAVEAVSAVLMGRSVLPEDVPAVVARIVKKRGGEGALSGMLTRLSQTAASRSSRAIQVRENCGAIAIALLRELCSEEPGVKGLFVGHFIFPGESLADVVLEDARFEDVEFRRTDFSRACLRRCIAVGVRLQEVVVDPETTRLELSGLDVGVEVVGVRVPKEGGGLRTIFDPIETYEVLAKVGAVAPRPAAEVPVYRVQKKVVALLESAVNAFRRCNPICTADDKLQNVFGERRWADVQKALVDSGVVRIEIRSARGPKKTFLRRQVLPELIAAGARRDANVPADVKALWRTLEDRFPG